MVADLFSITYPEVSLSLLFHHAIPRGYTHSSRNPNPCAPLKSRIHHFAPLLELNFFSHFWNLFPEVVQFHSSVEEFNLDMHHSLRSLSIPTHDPFYPHFPSHTSPHLFASCFISFSLVSPPLVHSSPCCLTVSVLSHTIPSATLLFHEPRFNGQKTPEPTF